MSIYPEAIDGYEQLPIAIDGVTKVNAFSINVLREAILNIENELGINPSGDFDTLVDRLTDLEAIVTDLVENGTGGGGGGTGNHQDLDNIIWDLSGHLGNVDSIAGFNSLGASSYYQIGLELQAWSTELDGLANLISGTGIVKRTAPGVYSVLTDPLSVLDGGTGGSSILTAQQSLNLEPGIDIQAYSLETDALSSFGSDTGAIYRTGVAAFTAGTLPISFGGTGNLDATSAFNALSPVTTLGDIIYRDGSGNVRLAGNTTATKKFLTQTGNGVASAAPGWNTIVSGDLPSIVDTNARIAVNKNSGATVGTRRRVNFIEGSGVTLTVADDPGNEEIDVTIAASGSALADADYGDITVSSTGTVWTIDNDVVTFAKMQNVATGVLLGRTTASTGDIETITVGSPITLSAGVLDFDETTTLGNNARVAVAKNSGATTGTRRKINFIEGSGVGITVSDDSGSEKVDITITTSGITSTDHAAIMARMAIGI